VKQSVSRMPYAAIREQQERERGGRLSLPYALILVDFCFYIDSAHGYFYLVEVDTFSDVSESHLPNLQIIFNSTVKMESAYTSETSTSTLRKYPRACRI
jgi:hypothetical protein